MKMAKYIFPDSNDRSKNDPSVIASSQQVLGIYNQQNEDGDEMQKATKKVQEWFIEKAHDVTYFHLLS